VHKYKPSSRPSSKYDFVKIFFNNCKFVEFPRAEILLDATEHLSELIIENCNLTEINAENLRGLHLQTLSLNCNSIEKLPKGLFEHTPYLSSIFFRNNKIKEIHADILDPLYCLSEVDLTDNVVIDAKFERISLDGIKRVSLVLLKQIIRMCDPTYKSIEDLKKENEKLKDTRMKLFNSDFTVTINGKVIHVNKEILMANSPLLAKLINENENVEDLELKDISAVSFGEILNFMYEKSPPSDGANLIELYGASARLEMKQLMDMTAKALMDTMTPAIAPDIIKMCIKFDHEELRKKAFDEVKKNFPVKK
jgi:hypothetical protein